MTTKLLLPNKFKIPGWCILIPSSIVGIILTVTDSPTMNFKWKVFAIVGDEILGKTRFFTFTDTNITPTLIGILIIVGGLLVSFSQEKKEDEFISNLRLSSLLWAVFVNYILLLLAFAFVYGTAFLTVMEYNMFTVLVIFILRFNYVLYKTRKATPDEK